MSNHAPITITATHLVRHITNVTMFVASPKQDLPELRNVQIEARSEGLFARASDRYICAETWSPNAHTRSEAVWDALLAASDLLAVSRMIKALPRAVLRASTVEISYDGTAVTFTVVGDPEKSITVTEADAHMPPLRRLFPQELPHAPQPVLALRPATLATLGKVRDTFDPHSHTTPLTFHPQTSENGPVVALIGDWFRAMVMPVRMGATRPLLYGFER